MANWKLLKETDDFENKEMRTAFMQTVSNLMDSDDRVVMLEADLGGASGSQGIVGSKHPDRFINVGIAEANMVGIAAGLSMRGFAPYMHTFAPFVARRAADQIYLEGAFAQNSFTIYASDPGFCSAANGGTHSTYEDIAIMRAMPTVEVYHPADAVQMAWLVETVKDRDGVHYIRANRKGCAPIYEPGSTFEIGKGNVIQEGSDVLLVATGDLVGDAKEAGEQLSADGISTQVIDMFSLKPFDEELLLAAAKDKKLIVTMENHSIYGGLGGIVAEIIAEKGVCVPLERIGVEDKFGQVGTVDFLKETYGLTAENAVKKVKQALK